MRREVSAGSRSTAAAMLFLCSSVWRGSAGGRGAAEEDDGVG
jgi:hypothetical protein